MEPTASRVATDNNRGDVQQAFIDFAPQISGGKATVRLGRFELKFGEGLVVSPREGPNIRQAWDGAWVFYAVPGLRVDLLAVRPVDDKAGWFEDTANPKQQLWGAYVTARGGRGQNIRRHPADAFTDTSAVSTPPPRPQYRLDSSTRGT
jgi:hypothetical protein